MQKQQQESGGCSRRWVSSALLLLLDWTINVRAMHVEAFSQSRCIKPLNFHHRHSNQLSSPTYCSMRKEGLVCLDDSGPRQGLPLRASSSSSLPDDDPSTHQPDPIEIRKGVLVLFSVPVAWGTFEPAVRYVYDIQPDIPAFLFQFAYYLIAASSLAIFSATGAGGIEEKNGTMTSNTKRPFSSLQGGFELGTYLFLGNGMQVAGLKTVPSDRAAFLLQLTTIFVPLVQSFQARNPSILPAKTWIACFMALAGVALIGLDVGDALPSNLGLNFSVGDLYIVLAAFFYTFHCLRLEVYARTTSAVNLAVAKATTEMMWCGVVIAVSLLAASAGLTQSSLLEIASSSGSAIMEYKDTLLRSLEDPKIESSQWTKLALATTWIGLVTVAYTISAQTFGQARVPPAQANLIYTLQPLFTALIAFIVLGETLGPSGYAGGLLIGTAVLLVIQNGDKREEMKTV